MELRVNNVTVVKHPIRYHPTIHPGQHKGIAFVLPQSSLMLVNYCRITHLVSVSCSVVTTPSYFRVFPPHPYDSVVKRKNMYSFYA